MTLLRALLIERIRQTGPMTVADYMTECLTHPEHGYYTTRDPLGAGGDFTTAPEISQMFGELLGLCLAQAWLDQAAPAPFTLAEAGPGRGTLMADILRATQSVPGFHEALQIVLVEISPQLRKRQAAQLGKHAPIWTDDLGELPSIPLFLIANEYFDALPIRQFVRHGNGWRERVIGLEDGTLALGLTPPAPLAALEERMANTQDDDVVELSPSSTAATLTIAGHIAHHGGAAIIIDYGDWRSRGDTFQAVARHEVADPLSAPGETDLTAHVDFEAIAIAAQTAGAVHTRMAAQGALLERLGITARAQALARNLSDAKLAEHIIAHRRLTHPDEMGQLFKGMAIHPRNTRPPPGFDP